MWGGYSGRFCSAGNGGSSGNSDGGSCLVDLVMVMVVVLVMLVVVVMVMVVNVFVLVVVTVVVVVLTGCKNCQNP